MSSVQIAGHGPEHGPLVSRTVRLARRELLPLLPSGEVCAWLRQGEGVVGFGHQLRFQLPSDAAPEKAALLWRELSRHAVVRDEVAVPGTGPLGFVSFPFDPRSQAGGVLIVPSIVVGLRGADCWVTTTTWDGGLPRPPSWRIRRSPKNQAPSCWSQGR